MKDLFAVVFLDKNTKIDQDPQKLADLAIRKLPTDTVAIYTSFYEAIAILQQKQQVGFVYESRCCTEDENSASGIRSFDDTQNEKNIHIGTCDIWEINKIFYLTELGEAIRLDTSLPIQAKKLALLYSLCLLSWFGHQDSPENKGFQKIFDNSGMLDYVRDIEQNAAASSNTEEYLNTLDTLNIALRSLISRIGIDGTGNAAAFNSSNQQQKHEAFKKQFSKLGLTSSSSKLFQKLGYALLAVSFILTTATLVGAAPVEFAVVGVAALATSLGLFSYAKKDLGYQCEQALINVSSACCPKT